MDDALKAKKALRKQQEKFANFYEQTKQAIHDSHGDQPQSTKKKLLVEALLAKYPEARSQVSSAKKTDVKVGSKRKALTKSLPFEFQTEKRIKKELEELIDDNSEHQPYEPLWKIV